MLKVDVLQEIVNIYRTTNDGTFHSLYKTLLSHLIYRAATGYLRTTVGITARSEEDIGNAWLALTGLGYKVELDPPDTRNRSMTISWE